MAGVVYSPRLVRFGTFEVDLQAGELRKSGLKLKLTGQPFQVLTILLERHGEVVTREELQKRLWPDTFVDVDHNLNTAINKIREVLGDSAESPRFVETLPRRGYRFLAPAEAVPVGLAPTGSPEAQSDAFHGWKRRSVTTAISAVFVIVAGVSFWVYNLRRPPSDSTSHLKVFPLTGSIGGEADPAFSPDGKQVAYVGQDEKQGNFNVYVKLIGAGRPLRLTSNAEQERFPAWSPDGRYIAFLRKAQRGNDVYVIPALGGPERKLTQAAPYDSSLSWSPDGKLLAIADKASSKEPISIFLVSVEDGSKRKVTSPPADSMGDIYPAVSPDGRALAFVRLRGASGALFGLEGDVYVQAIAGDAMAKTVAQRLTFDNVEVAGLDWAADGHSIVFSSHRSGSPRLWRIGLENSAAQPVAPGDNAVSPAISRKGALLAYRQDHGVSYGANLRSSGFISQLKLSGPAKRFAPARFCPSSQGEISPQYSPDGAQVVFSSRRSGDSELWLCKNDGSGATQLTSLGGFSGSPQWSPDGQKVVFDHIQGGRVDIRVAGVEQGLPVRVTSGNSNSVRPSWSNDGKWIYFSSDATGKWQVWKIPSQGGAALQVTRHGGFEARESPDGKFVYYVKEFCVGPDGPGIWKIPIGGGEETRLLDQGTSGHWAVALRGIYFVVPLSSRGPVVEFFNFKTQRITQIAGLPEDTRLDMIDPAFTISPDAETILYGQAIPPGNIMVVENFR
jgi:Tol biopolymer transport system component/DNA-binding winged helix-turn-helix (wHTH) protein